MEQRIEDLEARVAELARQLAGLQDRVSAVEAGGRAPLEQHPAAIRVAGDAPPPKALPTAATAVGTVSLIGRTLVVLGGAYLLRAITDASVVPRAGGVVVGLAYAAWWLLRCDRDAARGGRLSAIFHGLAAAIIAFPLIGETTGRFGVLPAPAGAAVLLAFLALGLAVALHRDLGAVGSITTLFALATALVLMVVTRNLIPYLLTLVAAAAAVEALALRDRWLGLRWPAALALDLAVLSMAMVLARPGGLPEGYAPLAPLAAVLVQLLLPLLYAASLAARTLLAGHPLTVFEGVQTCLALLVGLSGASRLGTLAGAEAAAGLACLLLAGAGYAAAFGVLEPRGRRHAAFHFQATLAGLLLLIGAAALLPGPALAISLLGLACLGLGMGSRSNRPVLVAHGVAYLTAAAFVAGLLGHTSDALLGPASRPWRELSGAGIIALLAAGIGYGLLLAGPRPAAARWWHRLPHAWVAALLGCGILGVTVRGLVLPLGAGPGPGADAAVVATVRSSVLALLAILLAWAGRRFPLPELSWLVYPVLACGGMKLLFEDLRHGRPSTLFLSLTLYGGALLMTPRLLRRETATESRAEADG